MESIIKKLIELSTSAPSAISYKREVIKNLFLNNINNLNEDEFFQFILELKNKDNYKISPYNLSHNEFTDCCGCFDIIKNGIIYCNECNMSLHDAYINYINIMKKKIDSFENETIPKVNDYCTQMVDGHYVNCQVSAVNISDKTFDVLLLGFGEEMLNIPFSKFKRDNHKTFDKAVRPLIKYLCENHNSHVSVIVIPTSAELLSGEKAFQTNEYLID